MEIPRLIAITPGDDRELGPWLDALAGVAVLIREPRRSAAEIRSLVEYAARRSPVIVHVRCAGAHELAAHWPVHLSEHAPRLDASLVGRSLHTVQELDTDYAFLSPIWPTSKAGDVRDPLGIEALPTDRPFLALGGITPARYALVRRHGGYGAAAIGAFFSGSPDDCAAAVDAFQSSETFSSSMTNSSGS